MDLIRYDPRQRYEVLRPMMLNGRDVQPGTEIDPAAEFGSEVGHKVPQLIRTRYLIEVPAAKVAEPVGATAAVRGRK